MQNMRRSAKVCWIVFVFSTITLAAATALTVYFTVFRKTQPAPVPPEDLRPASGRPTSDKPADEKSGLFDHRSHAVPGGEYDAVDYTGVGRVTLKLDGRRSHTHYFDEGPPVVIGKIVSMVWFDNETHIVLGQGVTPNIEFKRGTTVVGLTVADNTRDTHTDFTKVVIRSPVFDGAYCYYYSSTSIADDIKLDPRPEYAEKTESINFDDPSKFPIAYRNKKFAMRCHFVASIQSNSEISIKHSGTVKVKIGGSDLPISTSGDESIATYSGYSGDLYGELTYRCRSPGNCMLSVTDGIDDFKHDVSKIVPILLNVDPPTSTLDGGGKVKIQGIGLDNRVIVRIGKEKAKLVKVDETGTSMNVVVPTVSEEMRVPISATNKNGQSNDLRFEYSKDGKLPIKFRETDLTLKGSKFTLQLLSGIKYGPDHKFYATALNGVVYSFQVNENLRLLGEPCKSPSMGLNRVLLGLAFNYGSKENLVYVSSSVLEWKVQSRLSGPFAWANGNIHVLKPNINGKCLDKIGDPIITGLPVSNHDHGVNGLVFDDDGNLHIQVGGFTNAGHNHADSRLGGIDENPLSAASLIAFVNKPNFDGKVTYSSNNPGNARQISGNDVQVFSSGWRNSFGINVHTNGFLYATDNGASKGFGDMSVSCSTHEELPGNQNLFDKLGKVIKGKYAGHPNRNRGRNDPQQCRFVGVQEPASEGYIPPIATLESSTNGVVEYTANVFGGQLKGDLMLSKFSTDQSPGKVFRIQLDGQGNLKENPETLWEASGVSIEMSPWGDLFMPRVYRNKIVVIRPDALRTNLQTFISVMPPRGSAKGGNNVRITGYNIGENPMALFNGKPCTNVTRESSSGFFCIVPRGTPGAGVQVQVSSSSGTTESSGGFDYKYMNF